MLKNQLYFGDCLEILEKYLIPHNPDGFIDLVYIDPPFNSKRDYNILFESADLNDSTAQKQAFADTWSNISYMDELDRIQDLNLDLYDFLKALEKINTPRSAVAYLTTMALRLIYIHKSIKSTGSFYLHCDSTMSHYLKIVCDTVFGHQNYMNEIVWRRTSAHNDPKRFGRNTDRILFYVKSKNYYFQPVYTEYTEKHIAQSYGYEDENGSFKSDDLTGPGINNNDPEWKGFHPKNQGRSWSVPKTAIRSLISDEEAKQLTTTQKLDLLFENNLIMFTKNGTPRFKRYLDTMQGAPAQELWTDISPLTSHAKERLGYPTQKPESLMERIISASTKEGELVADFFCGCGTTIAASQRLGRKWLGVDISHLAVKLIMDRLLKPWEDNPAKMKEISNCIEVTGIPRDIDSAKELARNTARGRFTFQDWVIEFLLGGVSNPKKVGDGGYDGYITYRGYEDTKELILIEVKSGTVGIKNIREFIQVIDRQDAAMGVFVCFKEFVSSGMVSEARMSGFFNKDKFGDKYPKLRIVTVEELLDGYQLLYPKMLTTTFKVAKDKLIKPIQHGNLFE